MRYIIFKRESVRETSNVRESHAECVRVGMSVNDTVTDMMVYFVATILSSKVLYITMTTPLQDHTVTEVP